ncbi:MAG: hypothetical protein A2939_01665 [Parcubacteria group bacterium RIFCSPLOWO2_01_FULL_48_18]|nr:MAG: hypothetical protein A2939_01665 [Parcubacteria group bacterium RIFCSPLOWO2_01_FULL_48_18]
MNDKLIAVIISLSITATGIFIYHFLVTNEVLEVLEHINTNNAAVSVSHREPPKLILESMPVDGSPSSEDSRKGKETAVREIVVSPPDLTFKIPHYIYEAGAQRTVMLDTKILRVAKYVIGDQSVRVTADVPVCERGTCGETSSGWPITRNQSLIAIDFEFTNSNRVGAVAIDPAKQMRLINEKNFYVPRIASLGNTDYIEIPELSTDTKTVIAYIPRDINVLNFIFGADINNPAGIFKIDFGTKTVEALIGLKTPFDRAYIV